MLTVLYGSDTAKRTKRLEALLSPLVKSGRDIVRIDDVRFDPTELHALAGSVALFGPGPVVILSGIADRSELRDELAELFSMLTESENNFFLSEEALLAPILKKAKSAGATVEEYKGAPKKKAEAFNVFAFTDAVSARKRSLSWALYRGAITAGVEPRELAGKMFWAVKNMIIASKTSSATVAGMHPFVYGKAKSAAENFTLNELSNIAQALSSQFHQVLVSGKDAEIAFEGFLLRALDKQS